MRSRCTLMRFFAASASALFSLTTLIDSSWTAIDGWRCVIAGTLGTVAYMLNSILRRWIARDAAAHGAALVKPLVWHQVYQAVNGSSAESFDEQPQGQRRAV